MTEHSQRGFPQVTKVSIDRATIQAVAQLIAQKFDPEQIILFGSHARGNAGSHSDIDLLVVPASLDDWPKRDNPIRSCDSGTIHPSRRRPRHARMTALAEQRNNPYSFVNTALESRVILYERKTS